MIQKKKKKQKSKQRKTKTINCFFVKRMNVNSFIAAFFCFFFPVQSLLFYSQIKHLFFSFIHIFSTKLKNKLKLLKIELMVKSHSTAGSTISTFLSLPLFLYQVSLFFPFQDTLGFNIGFFFSSY